MSVSDPQLVSFSNGFARRMVDLRVQEYWSCKRFLSEYAANNVTALLGTPGGAVVPDGAAADGRKLMHDTDLVNLWNRCNDVVTDLEAAGSAKLIQLTAVSVNGNPIF